MTVLPQGRDQLRRSCRFPIRVGAVAITATVALALAAPASATVWTAVQTEGLLTGGATIYGVRAFGNDAIHGALLRRATSARCVGFGARASGRSSLFSCALTWPSPNAPSITLRATMYVRPWTDSSVCVTSVSPGSCPPAAPARRLHNDPRACGRTDQALCVANAARAAMRAAVTAASDAVTARSVTCHAGATWTSYQCSWRRSPTAGTGTVSFAAGQTNWSTVAKITDH